MFIADSDATSHMVNSEEDMTNLKDSETGVTVGDSRTIIRKTMAIGTIIRDMTENFIV